LICLQTMRKLFVTSVLAILVGQTAAAPASTESVEALLTLTKAESTLDAMYASIEQMVRQSMQQQMALGKTLTPQQRQVIDTMPAKFMAVIRTELTWDKLKSQFVQIYLETFDQEEIDGLVAFYRSTAGQAFVDKMPVLMQKSMAISQSQMQTIFPKMMAVINQALAEAKPAKNAIRQLPQSQMKDCEVCPGLVEIPGGHFEMGASAGDADAKPLHRVNVSGFLLGQTEVTYGQWKALMGPSSGSISQCGDDCPVSQVSWDDAQMYVQKLSERSGKMYRLPSEAEWEYAARAGGPSKWSFGDEESQLDRHAWYGVNSLGRTQTVGQKQANAFGLFDMYGNVWEWVQDVWHPSYSGAPADGSAWMSGGDGELRVLRGGAWFDKPASVGSSYRSWNTSVVHYHGAGLRVARN